VQGENHGFFPKIEDILMFDGSGGGKWGAFRRVTERRPEDIGGL